MSDTPLFAHHAGFDAASVTVTTSGELYYALRDLSAGEGGTIYVDGSQGPYTISAKYLGDDGAPVLIKPLNEDEPPHVQEINVVNSSNLTITGMEIDSEEIIADRSSWVYDVNIINASNITFVDNVMQGRATEFKTESNGADWGQKGAMIRDSENIIFNHNTMDGYKDGIVYLEVAGLDISYNEISGIQGDGMRGGGIQDATITNNYLHDFHGTTQTLNHSDMIQIWGNSIDSVTQNVEISDNILDAGDGAATQGILILNEDFHLTGYYSNISVHDNVIHNALAQGIGVDHVLGLEVYDNTVLWNQNATTLTREDSDPVTTFPRLILRDSPDARVEGNITGTSLLNGELLVGEDNVILSYTDPQSEFYAHDHFVNLSHEGDLSLADLALRTDSPLYDNFGAALSSDPFAEDGEIANGVVNPDLAAVMSQGNLPGALTGVALSAEFSIVDGVPITEDSATVRWIFSDGSEQEGIRVNKIFTEGGEQSIRLEITDKSSGELTTVERQFTTEDPQLIELDFGDDVVDLSSYNSELEIRDPYGDGAVDGRDGDGGFALEGSDKIMVDRTNTQISNQDSFRIDLGFQSSDLNSSGDLAMLHKAFNLSVQPGGHLKFGIDTDAGGFSMQSEAPVITDTEWHDISVVVDGPAGLMQIEYDGEVVASGDVDGATTASTGFDLVLGSLFGTSAKGNVDHFAMSAQTSSIYEGTTEPTPVDPDPVEPVDPVDPDPVDPDPVDPVDPVDPGPVSILSGMTTSLLSLLEDPDTSGDGGGSAPTAPTAPPVWGNSLFDILQQTGWYSDSTPVDEDEEDEPELSSLLQSAFF